LFEGKTTRAKEINEMSDIILEATGPNPASLTGHAHGDVISVQNDVGEVVTMDPDPGLFVPDTSTTPPTQPATSIPIGASVNYVLGAATPAAGKGYDYSWGPKRGMKSGTIKVS
jgi:hypothetical protein